MRLGPPASAISRGVVAWVAVLTVMLPTGCSSIGLLGGGGAAAPPAGETRVEEPRAPLAPLPSEIRIGSALTLSGANAVYGQSQRKGLELAVERLNQAGGVGQTGGGGGVRISLRVEDDQGTPEGAVSAIRQLIEQEDPLAIFGPTLSTASFAAIPLAQEAGIPVLAISATADGIVDIGDWVFRIALPEAAVIPGAVRLAIEKLHPKSVAIIYDRDDAYALSGYRAFKKALEQSGLAIAAELSYATGDQDLTPQLLQIRASNPDAIVASSLARDAVSVLRRARRLDITVPVIGNNGFSSPFVIRSAGTAADGLIVGTGWNADNPNPLSREFVKAFRARYGENPDEFAAYAYAGLEILTEAIARDAAFGDRGKLRTALASTATDTVVGKFRFFPNREPDHPPMVQIVRHGRLAILK